MGSSPVISGANFPEFRLKSNVPSWPRHLTLHLRLGGPRARFRLSECLSHLRLRLIPTTNPSGPATNHPPAAAVASPAGNHPTTSLVVGTELSSPAQPCKYYLK